MREVAMLIGDRNQVAQRCAAQLGIDRFMAEAMPEENFEFVRQRRAKVIRWASWATA